MTEIKSPFGSSGYPANPVISGSAAAGGLITASSATAASWLAIGVNNEQMLGVSSGAPAWQSALVLQAATAVAGYTLVNGTGTIISWTAPNDGALHRAVIFTCLHCTSAETGGQINLTFTSPDGNAGSSSIINANKGSGTVTGIDSSKTIVVEANTTVAVTQGTALTAGAAVMWAEIWAS